ncbi:flavodoxin domain-containing protein [Calidifontibacillus oryziterrae]|uniref:flavodoxin domain-containing protein n=1 Tax=Calidifontibacillus oryziterrae TaxID=1191699 RepID=UPI0003080C3C|nr:flavodoxin domain-containing protein [Calidifontibacillus oryziterrae]
MNTIIIYASKHGTAKKSVERLEEKASASIHSFHVKVDKIPSLEGYDTVIIGGSIYLGKVQKELMKYTNDHLDELLTKKVGLFLCAGHPDEQQLGKELHDAFPEALLNHATVKEIFGHEFDLSKLNFIEKFIVKKIVGITESQFALSEEKIDNFAEQLLI